MDMDAFIYQPHSRAALLTGLIRRPWMHGGIPATNSPTLRLLGVIIWCTRPRALHGNSVTDSVSYHPDRKVDVPARVPWKPLRWKSENLACYGTAASLAHRPGLFLYGVQAPKGFSQLLASLSVWYKIFHLVKQRLQVSNGLFRPIDLLIDPSILACPACPCRAPPGTWWVRYT